MAIISRRALVTSALASLFTPSIVRTSSLMPVPMLAFREARRATRIRLDLIVVEQNLRWFEAALQKALEDTLAQSGPIPYSDAGWKLFKENSYAIDRLVAENFALAAA